MQPMPIAPGLPQTHDKPHSVSVDATRTSAAATSSGIEKGAQSASLSAKAPAPPARDTNGTSPQAGDIGASRQSEISGLGGGSKGRDRSVGGDRAETRPRVVASLQLRPDRDRPSRASAESVFAARLADPAADHFDVAQDRARVRHAAMIYGANVGAGPALVDRTAPAADLTAPAKRTAAGWN